MGQDCPKCKETPSHSECHRFGFFFVLMYPYGSLGVPLVPKRHDTLVELFRFTRYVFSTCSPVFCCLSTRGLEVSLHFWLSWPTVRRVLTTKKILCHDNSNEAIFRILKRIEKKHFQVEFYFKYKGSGKKSELLDNRMNKNPRDFYFLKMSVIKMSCKP